MEPRIATVSQINGYVKKILDHNVILNNVWVKGEISNFKLHYSGHMYITLKDETGVLKAVMFKGAVRGLSFQPEDGMKVMARGRVTVYEAGGSYQLYIEEMTPDGVGELYIAYEKLKKSLAEEGLFDEQLKKPIPKFPRTVGVVTATTGAAVRDIINVISRRYPCARILIYPSLVQGPGAAANIVEAIEYFNAKRLADTLIVGRGGGSIEDLWAFNEESVARAIFASEIPIISAVGHETDFTIADFVADLRAPTPSAAAEIAVPSRTELIANVAVMRTRMLQAVTKQLENRRLSVQKMKLRTPTDRIQESELRLDSIIKSMQHSLRVQILDGRKSLGELCARLDAMSPLAVLSRGYAIAQKKDGEIIRFVKDAEPGEKFALRLRDGELECVVESV